MKFAVQCNDRLLDRPHSTRQQAEIEVGVIVDSAAAILPSMQIFALVPVEEWDQMKEWAEDLHLVISDDY